MYVILSLANIGNSSFNIRIWVDFDKSTFCIYVTGSSGVEQWARYPEVAGSIPVHVNINFQISYASN